MKDDKRGANGSPGRRADLPRRILRAVPSPDEAGQASKGQGGQRVPHLPGAAVTRRGAARVASAGRFKRAWGRKSAAHGQDRAVRQVDRQPTREAGTAGRELKERPINAARRPADRAVSSTGRQAQNRLQQKQPFSGRHERDTRRTGRGSAAGRSGGMAGAERNIRAASRRGKNAGSVRTGSASRREQTKPAGRRSRPSTRQYSAAEQAARAARRQIIRRIIMWAIVILAAVGVAAAGLLSVRHSLTHLEESTARPDPADAYREIPCTPKLLSGVLENTHTYAGKPISFTSTLTNTDKKRACYLDGGYSAMRVEITSGDQLVWDSQACEIGDEHLQLLIGAGRTGTFAVQWPGIAAGRDCTGTSAASPGAYHAQFYWKDNAIGDAMTIDLQKEPPPPPTEGEQPAENEQSGAGQAEGGQAGDEQSESGQAADGQ